MRQGPGFGPRSSASARSSSGGGVRHAGSNPSEGSERSYDWSYVRSLSMLPSRPRLGPSPWRESSILNPGEAMWGPRNAYPEDGVQRTELAGQRSRPLPARQPEVGDRRM